MDFASFRHSHELSDVEVILKPEDRHYSLHKFPLYTKSEYFRDLVTEDTNLKQVTLEDFPGGPENFERIADFCYSHFVEITKDNVVNLACAAKFLRMQGNGNLTELSERHIEDLLTSAKLTRSVGIIVGLLVQCDTADEVKENIRDKCIGTIIQIWSKPPSRFPYKRDQGPNIQDLSLDTVRKIIEEGRKANIRGEVLFNVIREYTERYLRKDVGEKKEEKHDLKLNLPEDIQSDDEDGEIKKINGQAMEGGSHNSSDSEDEQEQKTEQKKEEESEQKEDNDDKKADDDKEERTDKDDEAVKLTEEEACSHDDAVADDDDENKEDKTDKPQQDDTSGKESEESDEEREARESEFADKLNPLVMELPEKARTLRDESSIRWVVQALQVANTKHCDCRDRLLYAASTVLAQIPEKELRTMTPDLVRDLLNEAGRSGFHFANTICVITDFYILDKVKEGLLDKETFIKLAQALPEGFRNNADTLYEAYGIMAKDLTPEERDEVLKSIDLSRLSEDSLAKAYENEAISAELIIPALVGRCKRLKGDLDKAAEIIKTKEAEQYQLAKSRPYTYFTSPELPLKKSPTQSAVWPMSARDTRYDSISPYDNLSTSHKSITSPKPVLKPVARKSAGPPLSARYHHELPQTKLGGANTGRSAPKFTPVTLGKGSSSSLPGTPRSAWGQPKKASPSMPPDALLPDYSSSGIGPEDARQILYELSLTSPRLSYMYNGQSDVPERDYHHHNQHTLSSPRRAKKH